MLYILKMRAFIIKKEGIFMLRPKFTVFFKHIVKYIILGIFIFSFLLPAYAENSSIDTLKARTYFLDITKIVKKDNNKLWGKSLYTPILFVDTQTNDMIANEADDEGILKKQDSIYIGKFPKDQIIANSVTNLGAKQYAMIQWQSIGSDELSRNELFIHEMFHSHQKALGLESPNGQPENKHLDEMDARIYLKLEWAALNKALNSTGEKKIAAITDALTFRQHRRQQYDCGENENILEIHEGMAEYTGIICASKSQSDILEFMKKSFNNSIGTESFVRSFAYYSGSAYGILLDEKNTSWRKKLTYNSDLGEILKDSYKINLSSNSIEKAKNRYNYKQIYQEELSRKQAHDKKILEYQNKFVNNSTVIIELDKPRIGFNPSNLIPFKEIGTIYPNITITDSFGTLNLADGGCLLSNDWKTATISADNLKIENDKISGKDWTIQLNSDYTIIETDKNYRIKK